MKRAGSPRSLTLALFLRVSVLVGVMLCALGGLIYLTARDQIDRLYDGQLITGANVLRALMIDELREVRSGRRTDPTLQVDDVPLLSDEDRRAFDDYADWRMFRVWREEKLALSSDTGPQSGVAQKAPAGFSFIGSNTDPWRAYTLPLSGQGIVIQVGERVSIRNILITRVALALFIPLLFVLPAILSMIWLSLSDGLSALRDLVSQIGRRTPRDLEPLAVQDWPSDFSPLVRSINLLFARVARTFDQERRFVEHAAHQMRTPLAALRLQTQLVAREDDPAERKAQAAHLTDIVDRAASLIEKLLTLARLDAEISSRDVVDLHEIIASVVADLAASGAARGIAFSLEGEAASTRGDATVVRLLVANLLENAFKHTPDHSEVKARLEARPEMSVLVIIDDGPGIPARERAQVFERFYQGKSFGPNFPGSGLGLAIAAQAARTLNAKITLGDRADGRAGLCARVEFPSADASAAAS